jgi:ribosomal protein S6--L-glutamate ligase
LLLILYHVVVHREFARRLTGKIRETLRKTLHFKRIQIEEILQQSEGYGIALVLIEKISHIAGLTLGQSGLRERDLIVLSIERGQEVSPVPKVQTKIQAGYLLLCYGKPQSLRRLVLNRAKNEQQTERKEA